MREKRTNRAGYVVIRAGYVLSLLGYNNDADIILIEVP